MYPFVLKIPLSGFELDIVVIGLCIHKMEMALFLRNFGQSFSTRQLLSALPHVVAWTSSYKVSLIVFQEANNQRCKSCTSQLSTFQQGANSGRNEFDHCRRYVRFVTRGFHPMLISLCTCVFTLESARSLVIYAGKLSHRKVT